MKRIQTMMCIAFVLCCGAFAQAQVTGSGTTNYLPLWTGSSALGNSLIYQNNTNIGVGTTSPQYALDVNGHINTSEGYRVGESLVLTMPGGSGSGNIVLGYQAMPNSAGGDNTAAGSQALQDNSSGGFDTAIGWDAMGGNVQASYNTAVGSMALALAGSQTTGGDANTGVGYQALSTDETGGGNTAIGADAGYMVTSGSYNTLLGDFAGAYGTSGGITTGSYNIAIGANAGSTLPGGGSYNIDIANAGESSDSGVVRFGTAGQQTSFFAAGIRGVTTGENNAVAVVIDSNGQLGTVSSSRRFKTDIQDMGEASRALMRLRPVTFRYKKPFADGSQPLQFGLITEEVANVLPDLVAYGNDGQPESVKYQVLDSLLLNEMQRQEAELESHQSEIQNLRETLTRMETLLDAVSPAARAQLAEERTSETTAPQADRQ